MLSGFMGFLVPALVNRIYLLRRKRILSSYDNFFRETGLICADIQQLLRFKNEEPYSNGKCVCGFLLGYYYYLYSVVDAESIKLFF